MTTWSQTLLLGAGFGVAFLLGQRLPVAGAPAADAPLYAQGGRGPINPPPPAPPTTPSGEEAPPPIVYSEEGGHSASGNGVIAVTGSYGVGTSVLYLVDTVHRQLAIYKARGGSAEQRRIVLVGARRIDLDLQLPNYNDRSEYDYDALKDLFDKRGKKGGEPKTGLETGIPSRK